MGVGIKRSSSAPSAVCYALAAAALVAAVFLRARELDSPLVQLAVLIVSSVLIYAGGVFMCRGTADPVRVMKRHLAAIFVLYLALLVNFTIFDGHFGRVSDGGEAGIPFSEYFSRRVNLVPFRMIYRQTKALVAGNYLPRHFVVNVIGNLAAFAPFALFLPVFFKKCRRFGVFFVVLSAIILAVETCQLLTRVGSFDVDDYILNMLGAALLFGLLATKRGKKIRERMLDPLNKYTNNRS